MKKDNTMKIFKTLLTFSVVVTSTLCANDYAVSNSYPLFNDMKMAKKEQLLLKSMRQLINDRKHNNKEKLLEQKKIFSAIIQGLERGDKILGLHGTDLHALKIKIATIQLLWSQENMVLDSAIHNKMYLSDASETLDRLSSNITELNRLYEQSYARYKKNSMMKSLVSSYMQQHDELPLSEPMYALK
jgi:hypothetical protein